MLRSGSADITDRTEVFDDGVVKGSGFLRKEDLQCSPAPIPPVTEARPISDQCSPCLAPTLPLYLAMRESGMRNTELSKRLGVTKSLLAGCWAQSTTPNPRGFKPRWQRSASGLWSDLRARRDCVRTTVPPWESWRSLRYYPPGAGSSIPLDAPIGMSQSRGRRGCPAISLPGFV